MEDQIFTPQETPSLDDVMNTEQEDVVYTPLDNVINDEIHTQTEPSDVEIPESEEIETGEPIEVTIEDQIITPKKNRIDFQGYELDNISEADNENDVPSIKQVRDIVEEVESEKQDKLTAGDNITITDNVISATDTTYTAGDNITITDNVISATDTTYTAGSGLDLTGTTFSVDTITNSMIGENAVTTTEIADDAITTAKIGDTQVTVDKLASNAVTTGKIADNAVTNAKLDWSTIKTWEPISHVVYGELSEGDFTIPLDMVTYCTIQIIVSTEAVAGVSATSKNCTFHTSSAVANVNKNAIQVINGALYSAHTDNSANAIAAMYLAHTQSGIKVQLTSSGVDQYPNYFSEAICSDYYIINGTVRTVATNLASLTIPRTDVKCATVTVLGIRR